jgi:leucyl aminopeptidase
MTKISRANSKTISSAVILVANKKTNYGNYGLSRTEIDYVKHELTANDKKTVAVNQYNKLIIIQTVNPQKETYKTIELWRKAGAGAADMLNQHKQSAVTICDTADDANATLAFAEGLALANYQFLKYKADAAKEKNTLAQIFIQSKKASDKQIDQLAIVTDAIYKARTLVNEPVSFLTATQLGKEFEAMGKEAGFKVEVFNKAKIESLKMGGLLAVNKGSIDPPTFTVMEYNPRGAKNKKPIVLVGKGVVYDTGGLSLKPTGNSMDLMKCDMAGSAAVGCAMFAIAKAKLPLRVIALVPATDNRPGGNAYAPGDVINMMSGHTVEMLNADAEGRMILADALHYAKRYEPELVMEFSTLTGAAKAAIGSLGITCMGTADERVKNKLIDSGKNVYEPLAEMPFWDEYDDMLKSDIADMKNIGGPEGGSITAGKFLARYTNYPYMHFDIAGPAFLLMRDSWRVKGGTGVGVRLLFEFLKNK